MSTNDALLAIDIQSTFLPPDWLVSGVRALAAGMHTVATVERHDEAVTPFHAQLGWTPAVADESLIEAQRTFVKNGYLPPREMIRYFKSIGAKRVFVCGLQAETCVLAAGFMLFDAGLHPTILSDLVVGSSIDRSGALGVQLWRHHFGAVATSDSCGSSQSETIG